MKRNQVGDKETERITSTRHFAIFPAELGNHLIAVQPDERRRGNLASQLKVILGAQFTARNKTNLNIFLSLSLSSLRCKGRAITHGKELSRAVAARQAEAGRQAAEPRSQTAEIRQSCHYRAAAAATALHERKNKIAEECDRENESPLASSPLHSEFTQFT